MSHPKQKAFKNNPGRACTGFCETVEFGDPAGDYTVLPDGCGCTWFADNLNRPGDTEADLIASGWVEATIVNGNWSINSDGYLTNDIADTWLTANCPSPAGRLGRSPKEVSQIEIFELSSLMKVFCGSSASGDQLRLAINIGSTLQSPNRFVQLEVDETCGSLSLWGESGQIGESVPVPGATLNELHQLTFCLDLCTNDDEDEGYIPDQVCTDSVWIARVDCADGTTHVITFYDPGPIARASHITGYFSLGVGDLTGTPFFSTASAQLIRNYWTLRANINFAFADCPTCDHLIPDTCEILTDNFDRENSTNIGCPWEETIGEGEIENQKLKVTTAQAIMRCMYQHPREFPNWNVSVVVRGDTAGDQARVIVDYVDSSNYHFAEITFGDDYVQATLKLWDRSGGTNTQVGGTVNITAELDTDVSVEVCLVDSALIAAINMVGKISAVATPHDGKFCGLGTGTLSGSAILFDNFNANRGLSDEDSGCELCPTQAVTCVSMCTGSDAPRLFKLVVSGITGGPACSDCGDHFDGTHILTHYSSDSTNCLWSKTSLEVICGGNHDIIWHLGLHIIGSEYWLQVILSISGVIAPFAGYTRVYPDTAPLDCLNFVNLSIPQTFSSVSHCRSVPSTVIVTSL